MGWLRTAKRDRAAARARRDRGLLVLFLFLLLLFASAAAAGDLDRVARLEAANAAYQSALEAPTRAARRAGFEEALRGYASLVEDGVETSALFVNLGNAALQAEERGQAVLAYRRALLRDPSHGTARQNLEVVRDSLPGWVPRPEAESGFRGLLEDERVFPRVWRVRGAACAFLVACVAFALAGRRRHGAWRGVAIIALLLWGVLGLSVFLLRGGGEGVAGLREAVIVVDETVARTADSARASLALPEPLPAGTEVKLLERRTDWARVRLANGRELWVRSGRVAPLE